MYHDLNIPGILILHLGTALRSRGSYTNPYHTTALLKTFLDVHHADEWKEIANWLLFWGTDIKIREIPREVVKEMQDRMAFI